MKKRKALIFSIIFATLLTSCSKVKEPYREPDPLVPTSWKDSSLEEAIHLNEWWKLFEDPGLNELEEKAICYNQNGIIAYQRMLQAYYQSKFRAAMLSPQLFFAPAYFQQETSNVGAGAFLNSAANQTAQTGGTNQNPVVTNNPTQSLIHRRLGLTDIDLPLTFSWQLDLWGKLTQNYLNAYYLYTSADFDYLSILNQITTDVALNYYLLRGFDTEWQILDQIIALRKENLEINKERYNIGLINYLDVSRAEVDYYSAQADRENVIRERELQVNILAVLIGIPASDFNLPFSPISQSLEPPAITAGIPSELLTRRPDILSSLFNVKATYAEVGVAYAQFFPDITLTGAIGYSSNAFNTLLDWQSRLWQIAVSVMQVMYDDGKLDANLRQMMAKYAEAIGQYEQTVLVAFREVEDALRNIDQRKKQEIALNHTVVAAEDAYTIAKERYTSGLINYLDVVVAERDLLNSARSAAIVHAERFVDVCLLAKSLGGGWED